MAPSSPKLISAVDEAGVVICSYSKDLDEDGSWNAIPPKKTTSSYAKAFFDVFLPAGFPNTVTADYLPYQIFDSLQAFSSSIASLMSNRAVLQGFGVGDATGSATGAVLIKVIQESTGRLATILFAHRFGQAIEPECKFYRYLADLLNDTSLLLDVLTPALPTYPKILALCASGIFRSLCGVSAAAAKASLSAHFAKNGNLAELNAKDSSQETVISLMGMLVGSLFVQVVQGRRAVWIWMFILLGIHLSTNYQAVRAVQMRSLNRQRAQIVVDEYLQSSRILYPEEVARKERIISWKAPPVFFARTFPDSGQISPNDLRKFQDVKYVITDSGFIFMKQDATARDALKAYMEALVGQEVGKDRFGDEFWRALSSAGWNLDAGAVETGPAIRIIVK